MDGLSDNLMRALLILMGGVLFWASIAALRLTNIARASGASGARRRPLQYMAAAWMLGAVALTGPAVLAKRPLHRPSLFSAFQISALLVTSVIGVAGQREKLAREGFLPPGK